MLRRVLIASLSAAAAMLLVTFPSRRRRPPVAAAAAACEREGLTAGGGGRSFGDPAGRRCSCRCARRALYGYRGYGVGAAAVGAGLQSAPLRRGPVAAAATTPTATGFAPKPSIERRRRPFAYGCSKPMVKFIPDSFSVTLERKTMIRPVVVAPPAAVRCVLSTEYAVRPTSAAEQFGHSSSPRMWSGASTGRGHLWYGTPRCGPRSASATLGRMRMVNGRCEPRARGTCCHPLPRRDPCCGATYDPANLRPLPAKTKNAAFDWRRRKR